MKLLITDDQNSIHLFMDKMIPYRELGITEVFHARNGREALELVEKEWPELLILDIRMPVMDGLALLEKLSLLQWEHRVLILSAYDEFEYARKCMVYGVKNYLLKPIDTKEMINALRRAVEELTLWKKNRLEALVAEYLESGAVNTEQIPVDFRGKGYGMIVWKAGDVPDLELEGVRTMFSVSQGEVAVQVMELPSEPEWRNFFERQSGKSDEITAGFSQFHRGQEEFFTALAEGLEAVKRGFYQSGFYYYQRDAMKMYSGKETEELSRQLDKSYQSGNVQEMKQAVEKLFFIFQRAGADPRYVQEFCYGFLMQLNRNFTETLQALKKTALTSEFFISDAAGVKSAFLRLMISMRLEIAPEEVRTDEDVVERIRHYIDTNYEKDLSLETLAKHFFISKYQISRLFKKQFGINFSDYVLKVRMEAAGMMLKSSGEKVDEIARRAGFEETSYFIRVFSKYYGISPGEYRKRR